jgi:hypothetical protein
MVYGRLGSLNAVARRTAALNTEAPSNDRYPHAVTRRVALRAIGGLTAALGLSALSPGLRKAPTRMPSMSTIQAATLACRDRIAPASSTSSW